MVGRLKLAVLTVHAVPDVYVMHCWADEFHSLSWMMYSPFWIDVVPVVVQLVLFGVAAAAGVATTATTTAAVAAAARIRDVNGLDSRVGTVRFLSRVSLSTEARATRPLR